MMDWKRCIPTCPRSLYCCWRSWQSCRRCAVRSWPIPFPSCGMRLVSLPSHATRLNKQNLVSLPDRPGLQPDKMHIGCYREMRVLVATRSDITPDLERWINRCVVAAGTASATSALSVQKICTIMAARVMTVATSATYQLTGTFGGFLSWIAHFASLRFIMLLVSSWCIHVVYTL